MNIKKVNSLKRNSDIYENNILEHERAVRTILSIKECVLFLAQKIIEKINTGNKLVVFGNGGSAADSQHFAAELAGRFKRKRKGLAALSLSSDIALITAIGNDFSFTEIYSRQIEALACSHDIVLGISTSGESENVIAGVRQAKAMGCYTAALTGKNGGRLKDEVDLPIIVDCYDTPRIQECHVLLYHIICEIIDEAIAID